MDVNPIDQGAVLRSGQAGVPNYAEQVMQQAMLRLQQQQADTQAINVNSQARTRQREADRQDALTTAVSQLGPNPSASQLAMLMYRFPEMSEALSRGWQTMDADERSTNFQQIANITAAAREGRFDLAARLLRQRVEADRTAGHEDPTDAAILDGLESQDANERQSAVNFLERYTASADPQHYASTYGSFQQDIAETDGIYWDRHTGQVVGQDPRGHIIPGPNGSFYQTPPLANVPFINGGQPAPGGQAPAPAQVAPGAEGRQDGGAFDFSHNPTPGARPQRGSFDRGAATALAGRYGRVTSTVRTPEHNREVGGVPNSNHLARNGGRAIDVARRRGVSHAQIVAAYRDAGYTLDPDTRDEGDHSHIVIASGPSGSGAPRRVRSVQEARRLPPGTEFVTPDGRTMRVPAR